ncbi:NAC domain-containing protein 46-like [Lolium rigidum]|uniref:NAC domain-containing protein 46-like n=1 Tax=Lolium rigidum TaxID=89674 RepID=UPI001F5DB381|nr:NAC domain-containing protein 46-like [Lolium rigidum]
MEIVDDDPGMNRHGYPRGYHFVPRNKELIGVLEDKLAGRPLPYPPNIFHDIQILDYHPANLYEAYKEHEEAGCVYFFSLRKFPGAKRTRPVRATKDGNWTASGHGKPVTRGGVDVGYKHTMVFYEKKKNKANKSEGKTDWAMHEYTSIIGPEDKQVADLALYRLYNKEEKEAGKHFRILSNDSPKKKKKRMKKNEAGQHVITLANGSPKLEELPSPCPTDGGMPVHSTSQANDYYHVFADAPHMVPSLQPTAVNYCPQQQATGTPMWPQQQAGNDFELADWDSKPPSLPPLLAPSTASGSEAIGHSLPTSQQQDAEYPGPAVSNEQPLTTLPPSVVTVLGTAAEGDYLDNEFKVLCEMQQEQPAASPCWLPMLDDDDDLPMLMDEENYTCTIDELLGHMDDKAAMSTEEADPDDQV